MKRTFFTWKPERDTLIALISPLLFWPVYWLNSHFVATWSSLLFFIVGNIGLCVALPAYVVLRERREPLSGLGITRRRWVLSIVISLVLFMGTMPQYLRVAEDENVAWLPHLIFNGIILWEVLFVHGWMQLRFERAFGLVPAIFLAAIGFGVYHIGTVSAVELAALIGFGVFYGVMFAITRNLLILLPLTWAAGSGMGSLMAGFSADWSTVLIYTVILLVQIAILYWFNQQRILGK